ncbi:MAG TPA: hypothetical protein VNC17_18885, partial [Thermoleophilaceae bacterium]|nr:hypothetical protein [Thermoleophilaceae bacterium]
MLVLDVTSTGAIDGDCLSPALRLAWRWANEEKMDAKVRVVVAKCGTSATKRCQVGQIAGANVFDGESFYHGGG